MTVLKKSRPSSAIVVKSNDLINAKFNLSVAETRIILLMVSQINFEDEDFKTYRVRIKDFMESAGISATTKNVYSRAREYTKKLMKRVLEIPKQDGTWLQVSFISSAEYPAGKGFVELQFDPKLKPYLIQLKKRFTTYEAQNVLALGSFYSIRVYELLKQYEKIGKRVISVESLRDMLGLLDSYKSYYLFKQRVIEQAKKELDEHCDITFDYREIRIGRKIEKIEFNIIRQPEVYNDAEITKKDLNDDSLKSDENTIVEILKNIGFTSSQIERTLQLYENKLADLALLIDEISKNYGKGKINNLPAYLWDVIKIDGLANQLKDVKGEGNRNEAEMAAERDALEKLEREQKLIASWKREYELAEKIHNEKLADEGLMNLDAFRIHVQKNMGLRTMLIKDGELNQDHSLFRYMLGAFVAETQQKNIAGFTDWVKDVKGYHILPDKQSREDFRIAAKQASLF